MNKENNPTNMVKKTQGRRKIEIKKITNKESRAVTFSKRHKGLFKKASELSILCGAEIAIILQSLAGKVFAFGHPSPNVVIERYLTDIGRSEAGTSVTGGETTMQTNLTVQQYNQYYSQLCREVEAEKKKKDIMMEEMKNMGNDNYYTNNGGYWWDKPTDDMGLEELEEFMVALEELKKNVSVRADELAMINNSSLPSSSNSTLTTTNRFGVDHDKELLNQTLDFCSSTSIVPYDAWF